MTTRVLLHAPAARVQGVAGEPDDMERVHHRDRLRKRFRGGSLEADEPVHRDDLHLIAPRLIALGEPGLERLLGPSLDHVEQPGRARAVADRRQVDDHSDVLVAVPGVAPDVLVDAQDPDAVESVRISDQDPLTSARTASSAVFHATARPSATRATVRC